MKNYKQISRMAVNSPLVLEGNNIYSYHNLTTLKTSSAYKKQTKERIRRDLKRWFKNPSFDTIRHRFLDIAVVATVNSRNFLKQDVDNIAKVVLDALKAEKNDDRFLFYDDCQVMRLLIYKLKSKKIPDQNTDSLTISVRLYDPNKQMMLINPPNIKFLSLDELEERFPV